MLLLGLQLGVKILVLSKVTSESSNLSVSRVQDILLGVKFGVQISILLLSINQQTLLIINLLSQSRDHIDVDLNSTLIIILHPSFLISARPGVWAGPVGGISLSIHPINVSNLLAYYIVNYEVVRSTINSMSGDWKTGKQEMYFRWAA